MIRGIVTRGHRQHPYLSLLNAIDLMHIAELVAWPKN